MAKELEMIKTGESWKSVGWDFVADIEDWSTGAHARLVRVTKKTFRPNGDEDGTATWMVPVPVRECDTQRKVVRFVLGNLRKVGTPIAATGKWTRRCLGL